MVFTDAPEVQVIADDIIAHYHPHLRRVPIRYCFTQTTPRQHGKEIWGSMQKASSLLAFIVNGEGDVDFFICKISRPVWDALTESQRRALVDHELCHVWVEDGKSTLRPHDLEEFGEVVKRHGLWRPDLTQFFEASGQLSLFAPDRAVPDMTAHGSTE